MLYGLGIEDIEANHWVAWVLDLPGCYSAARSYEDALADAPARIAEYFRWLSSHGSGSPLAREAIEVNVRETFRAYPSEDDYLVNAFFSDDRRPLSQAEVHNGLRLLEYTRRDLRRVIRPLSSQELHRTISGEVQGSIEGILRHVAWAEWWYLDRLNLAFPREAMAGEILSLLERVRAHTRLQWPQLADSSLITERMGERWSPRKVVRRTLWHERAHTQQIARYLSAAS